MTAAARSRLFWQKGGSTGRQTLCHIGFRGARQRLRRRSRHACHCGASACWQQFPKAFSLPRNCLGRSKQMFGQFELTHFTSSREYGEHIVVQGVPHSQYPGVKLFDAHPFPWYAAEAHRFQY